MPPTHISERVTLTVDGEGMGAYVARPAEPGRYPGVVVAHQIFGVTRDICEFADRLAQLGYIAIAPELYHRSAPGVELEVTDEGRARGLALMREVDRPSALADVRAAVDHLRGRPDSTGEVGMLGVSFGGHVAYYAATQLDLALTIVLYAGWLTASEIPLSSPEPTLELTSGIKGRLVYVVGDADHVITEEQRTQIAERLEDEGVRHDFVLLSGGIPHAFLSEDTPSYHAEAAENTWRLIKDTLAAELPRG